MHAYTHVSSPALVLSSSAMRSPRRSDTLLLRGHVAEVVTLAEHNSVVAQDVVGSGDVEIEVRKRETGQVLAGREAHRFRADLHLDGALCSGEKSVRRV